MNQYLDRCFVEWRIIEEEEHYPGEYMYINTASNIDSSSLEDPTIPSPFETCCCSTFTPAKKLEPLIYPQNKIDSSSVKGPTTNSAPLIKENLHHHKFPKNVENLFFSHEKHPHKSNINQFSKSGQTLFWRVN